MHLQKYILELVKQLVNYFAKIVNGFKLKLAIIFAKKSNILRNAEYSSDQFKCKQLIKCFMIHD